MPPGLRAIFPSGFDAIRVSPALLAWYEVNRRDLPWRKTHDPYAIWVSEIMLQQTRVAVVSARYPEFLRRFPSVQRLAAARIASILNEWSGLGYYHRARNLHRAAKIIVRHHRGKFPVTAEAWRRLPGVGRYTAAAIASIAAGEPVAVVDGNVERVLRRLAGRPIGVRESWRAAEILLDKKRPGDFNQAMMELGATVCLPGEPLCGQCPIRGFCRSCDARETLKSKAQRKRRHLVYALVKRGDSVCLVQRSGEHRLMPEMWELPALDARAVNRDEVLFRVRHSITVTDYRVTIIRADRLEASEGKWVKISRVPRLPLTGLAKKILQKAKLIE
jgi:A/G-specific adenine glycosylase